MLGMKEIFTAVGTLGCAIGIGFVMQQSNAAEHRYGQDQKDHTAEELREMGGLVLDVEAITLTSGEFETSTSIPEMDAQIIKTAAPQALPEPAPPEAAMVPVCNIIADARPIAAATVNLTLEASCLPNERVTVHHNGMIFTEVTSPTGSLELNVPALAEAALFIFAFSNGDGAVAQTTVEDLVDFDRVVVQWKGPTGFQIHAREFGANYGEVGHIWAEAPGEVADAIIGQSGFMTLQGNPDAPEALLAEVYTFPVAATDQVGDVVLTVETEVSDLNCGVELEAQAMEVIEGAEMKTRNLTLSVPNCDSEGDFLVLNNLLQDLTVASK